MGQYLTIGLVTQIVIDKARAKATASVTPEEAKEALQKTYNQKDIYSLEETQDAVGLILKPEVAEPEMVDFLTDFYNLRYTTEERYRYGNHEDRIAQELNEIRSKKTLAEWLELADGNSSELFQLDRYVWASTPFSRGVWNHKLPTSVTQIILSIDGKIIMECYEGTFSFFTRLIRERLSKYRLASGLLVAISG